MKLLRVICDKIYENSKRGGKGVLSFWEQNYGDCINCVVWRVYGLFNWRWKLQWRDKIKNKIAENILTSVWKSQLHHKWGNIIFRLKALKENRSYSDGWVHQRNNWKKIKSSERNRKTAKNLKEGSWWTAQKLEENTNVIYKVLP